MLFWDALRGKGRRPKGAGVAWPQEPSPAGSIAAIYQVFFSEPTRRCLDPGFLPLDNSANRRPDWREYHPMRALLTQAHLDEERFYGVLSPKFGLKTRLEAMGVHRFAAENPAADVLLFSPYIDLQAMFVNTFVQGEYFQPGLITVAEAFFGNAGIDVDLNDLVMDYRRSVFCNYFIAKPRFWRKWLELTEQVYRHCEQRTALGKLLTSPARYLTGERVEYKVFVIERVTDLMLAIQDWRVAAHPPSSLSDLPLFPENPELISECNRLKVHFRDTGDEQAMRRYFEVLEAHHMPPSWEALWAAYEARKSRAV